MGPGGFSKIFFFLPNSCSSCSSSSLEWMRPKGGGGKGKGGGGNGLVHGTYTTNEEFDKFV